MNAQQTNPDVERRDNAVKGVGVHMRSMWILCPVCGSKTRTKVYEDSVLLRFPLFCPKCKKETPINVVKLKMTLSDEPDA